MLTESEAAKLRNCSVLVVEDEILIGMELEHIASSLGCRVVRVQTLAQAQQVCASQRFDIAILDVQLTDGHVFPVALICDNAKTAIMFVSGNPKTLADQHGFGARPFVTKPFSIDNIEKTMAQLV